MFLQAVTRISFGKSSNIFRKLIVVLILDFLINLININLKVYIIVLNKTIASSFKFVGEKLITRYFTEDVPTGLVPISSLGQLLGIPTPTIDSVIHLASILCGIDFMKEGRTVDKLHIENFLKEKLFTSEVAQERSYIKKRDKT